MQRDRIWLYRTAFVLILSVGVVLRLWNVAGPIGAGHRGYSNANNSLKAMNFAHAMFGSRISAGADGRLLYADGKISERIGIPTETHPPLVRILTAIPFGLFGVRPWTTSLVPVASSILFLLALYVFCRQRLGAAAGLVAMAVLAVLPSAVLYASFLEPGGPTLLLVTLLVVMAYARWLQRTDAASLALLLFLFWILVATESVGYYLFPLIWGHCLLWHRRTPHGRRLLWQLPVFGLLVACVHAFLALQYGSIEFFMQRLAVRIGSTTTETALEHGGGHFEIGLWLEQVGHHAVRMTTLPLLLVCAAGTLGFLAQRFRRRFSSEEGLLLVFLLLSVLHLFTLPNVSFGHEYVWLQIVPWIAISIAWLGSIVFRLCWIQIRVATVVALALLCALSTVQSLEVLRIDRRDAAWDAFDSLGYYLQAQMPKDAQLLLYYDYEMAVRTRMLQYYMQRDILFVYPEDEQELSWLANEEPGVEVSVTHVLLIARSGGGPEPLNPKERADYWRLPSEALVHELFEQHEPTAIGKRYRVVALRQPWIFNGKASPQTAQAKPTPQSR